jgi:hypothetical protein
MARQSIHVQLKDDDEAHHAFNIITYWKSKRQAARNIVRAISLYYALLTGDTTLLFEYFPLLRVVNSSPVASRPVLDSVTVAFQAKTEEEDIEDFLSEFM